MNMNTNNKTKPRRVDFFTNDSDYECAFLGSMGFSTRCIEAHTSLTPGQITYRLHKATIRRIDYRDGASDVASIMLRHMRPAVEKEVTRYLQTTFKT
jgi:hypothetical protein